MNEMTQEQYEEAVSFWTRKDAKAAHMKKEAVEQWIDSFLSSHNVLSLATASGDFVRCTPLEYTWHDGALWIFTEGGLKFKALHDNNHVAAAVYDNVTSFGGLQSVQISGTAEIVKLFTDAYIHAAAFRKIPVETLKKLPEPMWLIKITPSEITCLNSAFKKDGFSSRQIWKRD